MPATVQESSAIRVALGTAWRSQTIPQNLATMLASAVFNVFGAGVVGTRFSLIAVARSDV